MFFFQTKISEAAVSLNDFAFLEKMWTDWSPGWKWTPEDMEALKRSFRAKGTLEAALGYYRATLGPVLSMPVDLEMLAPAMNIPINVPALMFHGRDEGCIGAETLAGMEKLFPKGLRIELVPNAGHFVHQERPDHVNEQMLKFLKS
jgi:pimeloyl-ACP methyl ester carboxylesterase